MTYLFVCLFVFKSFCRLLRCDSCTKLLYVVIYRCLGSMDASPCSQGTLTGFLWSLTRIYSACSHAQIVLRPAPINQQAIARMSKYTVCTILWKLNHICNENFLQETSIKASQNSNCVFSVGDKCDHLMDKAGSCRVQLIHTWSCQSQLWSHAKYLIWKFETIYLFASVDDFFSKMFSYHYFFEILLV